MPFLFLSAMWLRCKKQFRRHCTGCFCGTICEGVPCFNDVTYFTIMVCVAAAFMVMASLFIPLWRYDSHGTTALEELWVFTGFSSRLYGVLQVKGTYSQSWNTVRQTACDYRTVAGYSSLLWNAWNAAQGSLEQCSKSESCNSGFFLDLQVRCEEYSKIARISHLLLGASFLVILMIIVTSLIAAMCGAPERVGGVVFGLYLIAGMIVFVMNIAWAVITDSGFKRMMEQSWYPYPSLSIGWYINLFSALMLLGAAAFYGVNVLPLVQEYDPVQHKIDKHKKKQKRREDMLDKRAQRQKLAGMNFPPPPGFQQAPPPVQMGAVAPTPYGYHGGPPQQFPPQGGPTGDFGICGPGGDAWPQGGVMAQPPPCSPAAINFGLPPPESGLYPPQPSASPLVMPPAPGVSIGGGDFGLAPARGGGPGGPQTDTNFGLPPPRY